MSSLNWMLLEDIVIVVSDTVAASAETRAPIYFATKVVPLPHTRSLIAGTGDASTMMNATFQIMAHSVCRNLGDVASGLPPILRRAAEGANDRSSTIYLFGWDGGLGRMRGFTFRTSKNFSPEEMPYGLGCRPAFAAAPPNVEGFKADDLAATDKFFIDLATRQRQVEDVKSATDPERAVIGGELIETRAYADGIMIRTIYQFADHAAMFNAAAANLGGQPTASIPPA